jgi:DNA-binding CsgD family transcriptional regulator
MSSREVDESLAPDHYQRDIEAVVDCLKLSRFLLMGVSRGVEWVVDYSLNHPDHVIALVLGTSGTERAPAQFGLLPAQDWDVFLHSIVPRDRSREEENRIVALHKQASDPRNYLLRRRVFEAAEPIEARLSRLRVSTLVMHARDYVLTPVQEGMKVAQYSGGRFVIIDGSDPYGSPSQGLRAIETFLSGLAVRDVATPPQTGILSEREAEVLRLLAAGKSNAQIADELVISQNTVIRHVSNIFAKIGVANRAQAAVYARDHGIG